MHANHRIIESGAVNRLAGEKSEQVLAERRLDARLPRSQRVKKLIPRLPLPRTRDRQDRGARGPGRAVTQGIAKRGRRKLAGAVSSTMPQLASARMSRESDRACVPV